MQGSPLYEVPKTKTTEPMESDILFAAGRQLFCQFNVVVILNQQMRQANDVEYHCRLLILFIFIYLKVL